MKAIIEIPVLLIALFYMDPAISDKQLHPDRIIASHKIMGRLVLFEEGDYLHVSIKSQDGKKISFSLGNEGCFLAKHYDKTLEIVYREVERYFPEGGTYFPANIIQSIAVDKGTAKWNAPGEAPNDEWSCIKVLKERLGKHN
jgi:hypothetical protein